MNFRALLELCRISNLPTVWSNTLMGVCIGLLLAGPGTMRPPSFDDILIASVFALPACLAMSLFYCAGMVMNDWVDRAIDQIERPHRPIPSGRISANSARKLGISMLALGLVIVLLTQHLLGPMSRVPRLEGAITASALVLCIVLYNLSHQRSALSIIFMGLCRSLLVITCIFVVLTVDEMPNTAMEWLWFTGPAVTLLLYTFAISIIARREMETKCFAGPKTIMNMIAGMPLLDAAWLLVMGLWPASLFCVACAGMTKLAHRKVAGS